mmetsp:Transcript_49593/g.158675  ORF Transcript_49593/g.158675 Transcript_49593/m.158675 type:complete len:207 (+) Transcript_49593:111-731(+)
MARTAALLLALCASPGEASDALQLLQVGLQVGSSSRLTAEQPERKHTWERVKDKFTKSGLFAGLLNGVEEAAEASAVSAPSSSFVNASQLMARSFKKSLDRFTDPEVGHFPSLASRTTKLGLRVCAPSSTPEAGAVSYLVDNSRLQASTNGVGFRFSKRIMDRDLSNVAHWDSVIHGVDAGDDWVKVGECFLPKKLNGVQVLKRQG